MSIMFFFMAFVNALVDATKDTLVVTAYGGGAEQLPFLTAYAVLPASMLFLYIYAYLRNNLAREQIFYATLMPFVAFFFLFSAVRSRESVAAIVQRGLPLSQWLPSVTNMQFPLAMIGAVSIE